MAIIQIKKIIEEAETIKNEGPLPLRKLKTVPTEFPIDSLSPIFKEVTLALHDKIQAPLPLCFQTAFAAANLLVQGYKDVLLPHGHIKCLSCFMVGVGDSGERKTSCDQELLITIEEYESILKEKYDRDVTEWKTKSEIWNTCKSTILKDNKKYPGQQAKQVAIRALGEEPKPPLIPILIFAEPTYEGLCKLLKNGYPSIGIFSSEGGQFISGHAMNEENKIKTAAGLSSLWDRQSAKRIRSSEDITILSNKRVNLNLMVQPLIATKLLSDNVLKDQGFLSRILFTYPKSTAGTRFNKIPKTTSIEAITNFRNRIKSILTTPLPIKSGTMNELEPEVMKLSEDAKRLFFSFSDHIESLIAPDKELENIKGFANKLPEHAVRIACTIAAFENIDTLELSYEYLKVGIEIATYYAQELLRLFEEGVTDPMIILAEKLLDWISNKWAEEYISLPDICQHGPNCIREKASAEKIIKKLEDYGWLQKIDGPMVIKNTKRKHAWKIIKG
ncbi:YfjI family protein [Rickettsiales endosymbiont of Stachyamoeba lipophora]|uniref:YfjI family protein n=1 Tax=Rickettsiales endosymbiont of Stachyamoeba lipophora TaxID=2486578 RepID=UPI000F64777C|nr:YfjI family protein [Rickettsiales endosymbiont of Stachyamoeba lipophora]AZL16321.1 DUF3987 domain-containing protein [Rickettsiales endosymbiont of Stachyamoeba lipophora]